MKNLINKFKEKQKRKGEVRRIEETRIIDYFKRVYSKEHLQKDRNKFIENNKNHFPSTIYESALPIIMNDNLKGNSIEDLFVCAYMLTNNLARTSFILVGQPYDLNLENSQSLNMYNGLEIAYGRYNPSSSESNQLFEKKRNELKKLFGKYAISYVKFKEKQEK